MANKLGFTITGINPEGFPVIQVTAGGPFAAAGLLDGDAVISLDGQPLLERLQSGPLPTGRPLTVYFRRGDAELCGNLWIEPEPKADARREQAPPRPEPEPQPSPLERSHAQLVNSVKSILRDIRAALERLETKGVSINGLDGEMARLEAAWRAPDSDPAYLNRPMLLQRICDLKGGAEHFSMAAKLACTSTLPDDIRTATRFARALSPMLNGVRIVFDAACQPSTAPRTTQFTEPLQAPAGDPNDVPPMGGINWRVCDPILPRTPVPPNGPPPYGAAAFHDAVTGAPIEWNETVETPEFLEKVPDDPAEILAEIARYEAMLKRATTARMQAHYERRLEVLRSALLGVEPSPRPRRKQQEGRAAFYWSNEEERREKYWELVRSYGPSAVEYVTRQTAAGEYETVPKVHPEVHKLVEEALGDLNRPRNEWLSRQMTYQMNDQRLIAEHGSLLGASPKNRARNRPLAGDWADPRHDGYDPFRGLWGRQ
jgi:hypothetical protein